MNNKFFARAALAASSSLLALVGGAQAYGQTDAAARPSAGVGELVVTARKRAENIQDVPVTITALSAKTIETLQIKSIFDLATVTPGLYFGTTGGRNGGNKLQIRNFSTGTAGGSKASVFINGIYVSGDFSSTPLANLERIEVLKGPQSAAYGRATFVGAVNFVTKEPGNETTGNIDAVFASENEQDITGFVSAPVIADKVATSLAFRAYHFTGPDEWRNLDGYHFGDQSTKAITSRTVFTPTDNLKLGLTYTYVNDDDHVPPVIFNPVSQRNSVIARPDGTFGYYYKGEVTSPFSYPAWNQDIVGYIDDPGIHRFQNRWAATYEWEIGGHTISGFYSKFDETFKQQTDSNYLGHGTVVAPNAFNVPTTFSYANSNFIYRIKTQDEQFEFRVNSPQDQVLRYSFGYNHTKIEGDTTLWSKTVTATGVRNPLSLIFRSNGFSGSFQNPAEDNSYFGSLAWDVTPQLTLNAEARYQEEKITAKNYLATVNPVLEATYRSTLPRFSAQYKVTDDAQIYAVYSEGNNPGGFNSAVPINLLPVGVPLAYPEEKLKNYEIGLKSTWLDGRVLFNIAAYRMDWTNQQVSQTYVTNVFGPGTVSSLITGTASSRVNGVEIETQALVTDHFNVRGTLGYGKAKYIDFCSAPYAALTGIQDRLGCRLVNGKQQEGTPALQTSLSAEYTYPLGGEWNMYINGDWQHQSKVYLEEWDAAWIKPIDMVNARIGFGNADWTFEGFVRNLTDDDTGPRTTRVTDPRLSTGAGYPAINGVGQAAAGQQNVASTAKKPRQFGVRIARHF